MGSWIILLWMTIITVKTEGKTLSKLLYTFDNLSINLKRKDVSFSKLEASSGAFSPTTEPVWRTKGAKVRLLKRLLSVLKQPLIFIWRPTPKAELTSNYYIWPSYCDLCKMPRDISTTYEILHYRENPVKWKETIAQTSISKRAQLSSHFNLSLLSFVIALLKRSTVLNENLYFKGSSTFIFLLVKKPLDIHNIM